MDHDVKTLVLGDRQRRAGIQLTKTVPAHKKTVQFRWCKEKFSVMGPKWRFARRNLRKKLDKCFWCHEPFEDGDSIGLGAQEKGPNVVLCSVCARAALERKP